MGIILGCVCNLWLRMKGKGKGRVGLGRLALPAVVRWISQYTHGAADCTAARSAFLSAVLSSRMPHPTKRGCHCPPDTTPTCAPASPAAMAFLNSFFIP